ncbi:MAG: hypothetical protein J6Y83_04040, partial [Bacteroidales bacterium]|nr:hypothetical protein [Bacteroidales bacterium]
KIVNPAPAVALQAKRLYTVKARHEGTPCCKFYSSTAFTAPVKDIARSLAASPCEFFDGTL